MNENEKLYIRERLQLPCFYEWRKIQGFKGTSKSSYYRHRNKYNIYIRDQDKALKLKHKVKSSIALKYHLIYGGNLDNLTLKDVNLDDLTLKDVNLK